MGNIIYVSLIAMQHANRVHPDSGLGLPTVDAYPVSESEPAPPPYDVADDQVLPSTSGDVIQQRKGEERILRIESELKQFALDIRGIKETISGIKETISGIKGKPKRASVKKTRKRRKKRR